MERRQAMNIAEKIAMKSRPAKGCQARTVTPPPKTDASQ